MREIRLTKGFIALVDDADYEMLSVFKWYVNGHPGKLYAARYGGKGNDQSHHIWMHREILDAPDGMEVDHINGNRLDNRRCNLRLATRAENGRNRLKHQPTAHSKYKGVSWHKRDKVWQGTICHNGKYTHLGYFETEREAALAYNNAAIRYHGEFANLNNL